MDDERFCTKCGTDNGALQKKSKRINYNRTTVSGNSNLLNIDLSVILHWAANIFLFISACVLLKETCSAAESMTAVFLMYPFGIIFAIVYFILGMWYMIPATAFVLNGKNSRNKNIISVTAVMLMLTIIVWIFTFIIFSLAIVKYSDIPNLVIKIWSIFTPYQVAASKLVVLNILAIVAAVVGAHIGQKGNEEDVL